MDIKNLYERYAAKDADDALNHIRAQLDYLCYTAARINKLLDKADDSNDKGCNPDCDDD